MFLDIHRLDEHPGFVYVQYFQHVFHLPHGKYFRLLPLLVMDIH